MTRDGGRRVDRGSYELQIEAAFVADQDKTDLVHDGRTLTISTVVVTVPACRTALP